MTVAAGMRFAQVVVHSPGGSTVRTGEVAASEVDQSPHLQGFHYEIPEGMEVLPGHLVWVPFGRRELPGIVLGLAESSPVERTKPLLALIDPEPVLRPYQLALMRWIAGYYRTPLHRVAWSMFPRELSWTPEWSVSLRDDAPAEVALSAGEQGLVDYLRSRGPSRLTHLAARFAPGDVRAWVDRLVRRGLLRKEPLAGRAGVKPKLERVVSLEAPPQPEAVAALEKALQQKRLLAYLLELGSSAGYPVQVALGDLSEATGNPATAVRALAKRGLVRLEEREIRRDPLAGRAFASSVRPEFTADQEAAWHEIDQALQRVDSTVFLLHGVTGSGKTELYLRALEQVLAAGGQGIVLVPEISLTPQTIRRFAARFGQRLAVLHSRLAVGERYDEWRRIRAGEADVVIGPRSALFAPLLRPKLVVVDEEHEWTYKQQEMPCYHARDVAIKLGELTGATVVLGTATPDVTSYYRAERGEFRLLCLPHRVVGHEPMIRPAGAGTMPVSGEGKHVGAPAAPRETGLPPVEVVDLRAELRAGNRSPFSRSLQRAMAATLAARQQVILFLNRRGTASFVLCRDCGYVVQCPRCSAVLTHHGDTNALLCHHCNLRVPAPSRCPRCDSERIRYFGIGTEKVAQLVRELFPKARILRWDRDVTGGKDAHEEILDQFVAHKADVLIGTQMIAKGLDLPLVTLVGVVTADTALHLPDLRAGERTFQLLTQVAGRAGRSSLGGRVIVQTYAPDNYAIQAASRHDYEAFYHEELEFRRQQGYPPFGQLVRLLFVHANLDRCAAETKRLADQLRDRIARQGVPDVDVIGPAPCFLERIRGRYRWQIVLRGASPASILESGDFPEGWQVDVDPVSLL